MLGRSFAEFGGGEFLHFGEAAAADVADGGGGVYQQGVIRRGGGEVEEDAAGAFEALVDGHVEEDEDVGAGGEGFVVGDYGLRVRAAGALVGGGAPIVT